jgi:molybdopterin converting factor small subunit
MAALVNGERRSLDERVMNGDEVVLLAPPAGG